ncbi:MAG: putative signal peptide peptidase SppA [Pelotomaculum sp. PtaB.Bin104]|nr:MAG: putative signal peptide peptidase SppA [Pelotomaculum sp. PtaB.Bin104]
MRKKLIAGIILAFALFSVVVVFALRTGGGPAATPGSEFGEIGVIYVEGVIASRGGNSGMIGGSVSAEEIAATLRKTAANPQIKALVIRLNSPGGTPAAAQEISMEIERLRQSGKKVVASMGDTATSGAYWVAAGADQIVANPGTLTGSIGVIMQTTNLQELYDKLGINTETFKSGSHKDMGSASRPVTPEERAIFQSMIDDIYGQFIDVVANGRHKDPAEIRSLADGRVFTGRQALELGLVDRLGDFHDAVLLAGELAGIPGEPVVTEIGPKNIWRDLLGGVGGTTLWGAVLPAFPLEDVPYAVNLR